MKSIRLIDQLSAKEIEDCSCSDLEKYFLDVATIKEIAKTQGAELSKEYGDNVDAFLDTLKFWTKDDALEIDLLEKSDLKLSFNVTRCKYAEMYSALGVSDLGAVLSCNRDAALIGGFNPKASLDRKETIMSGDKCCTFRYTFEN